MLSGETSGDSRLIRSTLGATNIYGPSLGRCRLRAALPSLAVRCSALFHGRASWKPKGPTLLRKSETHGVKAITIAINKTMAAQSEVCVSRINVRRPGAFSPRDVAGCYGR